MGELAATFALAQDNCFGQPLESQLRSCLLGIWMCDAAGFEQRIRDTVYWVALLRYIGCTGHAHEVATVFGDEIAIRAQTLIHDSADPAEVMRDVVAFATAAHPPEAHDGIIKGLREGAHDWAVHNFGTGCDVGDIILHRLDFDTEVRKALAHTFERWNGHGYPHGTTGTDIPLAMRIVHISHDMEAIGRRFSPEEALLAVVDRRDRTYDPNLADLFALHGAEWLERLSKLDPWDAVLEEEPAPHRQLRGDELDNALLVAADFIDLKSPFMAGHSRRCAELATAAAERLKCDRSTIKRIWRAALVHEFGTTAVPNSIWDKPGPLTRAERDRVEIHAMLTEQILRRSEALAVLNSVAACHHEKADGSGYHKGLTAGGLDPGALVLEAADIYIGLTSDRADRPAISEKEAAAELGRLADSGQLDADASDAVLAAAGHDRPKRAASRRPLPGGLTKRELEVLRLAARGLTIQQIADELFIAPKTADSHIQHIYTKIQVSNRATAALWAMENGVVR